MTLQSLMVAVGTRVTPRPPHRTGQAELPHPAPTLGNDASKALRILPCPCDNSILALCPGSVGPEWISLGRAPSLRALRRVWLPPTPLFRRFTGTMGLPDFQAPFIAVFSMRIHRAGLAYWARSTPGSPGFRARCFRACVGSSTPRGPYTPRVGGVDDIAFRTKERRRHPGPRHFRCSIPSPHVPLSTLADTLLGIPAMTRGQRGSLFLHCLRLSLVTPCRLFPALSPCGPWTWQGSLTFQLTDLG